MVMIMGKTEDEIRKEYVQMAEITNRQRLTIEGLHTLADQRQKTIDVRNRAIEDLEEALKTKTMVCEEHAKTIASQEAKINQLIKDLNVASTGQALFKSQVELRDERIANMTEEIAKLATGLYPSATEQLHLHMIDHLRHKLEKVGDAIVDHLKQEGFIR